MTDERSIFDIEEEKIIFINQFLIDQCLQMEPDLKVEELSKNGKLLGMQLPNEQYQYFFNNKIPLLYIDLKLLIDGV